MYNSWFNFALQAMEMGFEAQQVIARRILVVAQGGAEAQAETSLMISEKLAAFSEAGMTIGLGAVTGANQLSTAKKVLRSYAKKVRANNRRLSSS